MATSKKNGWKSLYFPLSENFKWRRRACQKDPKNVKKPKKTISLPQQVED
jgi:hypothetical protein